MEFIYNIEKPSYNYIITKSEKLSKKYNYKKRILKKEYSYLLLNYNCKNYNILMKKKRKLDIKYINKIINIFKYKLKNKIICFLHGSYARNLNRWNSDIDLNILYSNKYRKEFLVIEEFIAALIYKLFDYAGRDKVHNIMIYLPMYEKTEYKIKTRNHMIKTETDNFYFKCRNNYEQVYPKILNSSRSFDDFKKYIFDKGYSKEWVYSYKGINIKGVIKIRRLLKIKDELLKENKHILSSLINELIEKLENYNYNISSVSKISELNKLVKVKNLNIINQLLLIMKEFIVVKNGINLYLNYDQILDNIIIKKYFIKKEIKYFQEVITRYRWFVDRIENMFLIYKMNFSSREHIQIDMEDIFNKYNKLYNSNMLNHYNEYVNNLIDIANKIIERINNNL